MTYRRPTPVRLVLALAGLALWALLAGPQRAQAQSLLSAGRLSDVPALFPSEQSAYDSDLTIAMALVDQGNGAQAYGKLKELHRQWKRRALDNQNMRGIYAIALLYLLRAGEQHAAAEEQEAAAREFVDQFPDDPGFPLAFYYLNQALYRQGKPLETSFFFDDAALATLEQPLRLEYYRMHARSSARQGQPLVAAEFLMSALELDPVQSDSLRREVLEQLARLPNEALLDTFLADHGDVAWIRDELPFLRIQVMINMDRLTEAFLAVEQLRRDLWWPSAGTVKKLRAFRREITNTMATRNHRIGVLLPLSSSSAAVRALAFEVLDGLRLAVQFEGSDGALPRTAARRSLDQLQLRDRARGGVPGQPAAARPASFELVVRDTTNDPERARQLVKTLVEEDQVIAIIGPVARAESEAAAEAAQALEVPLISLSVSMDVPPDARYAFRHSKSQEEEIRHLVSFAMDYLHAQRFAILYPESAYGESMMRLFWDEVEARQGRVISVFSFKRNAPGTEPVDLTEIFEQMTGLGRTLTPEQQALLEAVGDTKPDPIVDFDAIFVPLGPQAYDELRILASYPVTVDAEDVRILGTRFWNAESMIVAAEGKLKEAIFLDVYDRNSEQPAWRSFRRRHFLYFGHRNNYQTPSYYTAVGYDTFNLLKALILERGYRSRRALTQGLLEMPPYAGVTGLTSFLTTGASIKESMFFRLRGSELERVMP